MTEQHTERSDGDREGHMCSDGELQTFPVTLCRRCNQEARDVRESEREVNEVDAPSGGSDGGRAPASPPSLPDVSGHSLTPEQEQAVRRAGVAWCSEYTFDQVFAALDEARATVAAKTTAYQTVWKQYVKVRDERNMLRAKLRGEVGTQAGSSQDDLTKAGEVRLATAPASPPALIREDTP